MEVVAVPMLVVASGFLLWEALVEAVRFVEQHVLELRTARVRVAQVGFANALEELDADIRALENRVLWATRAGKDGLYSGLTARLRTKRRVRQRLG